MRKSRSSFKCAAKDPERWRSSLKARAIDSSVRDLVCTHALTDPAESARLQIALRLALNLRHHRRHHARFDLRLLLLVRDDDVDSDPAHVLYVTHMAQEHG